MHRRSTMNAQDFPKRNPKPKHKKIPQKNQKRSCFYSTRASRHEWKSFATFETRTAVILNERTVADDDIAGKTSRVHRQK